MLDILEKLPVAVRDGRVLMMLPQRDENIVLSTRNIPTAKVQHVSSINVIELLKHDCVIMPVKTVRWIELVFGEGLSAEEATRKIAEEIEAAETTSVGDEVAEEAESLTEETAEETSIADEQVTASHEEEDNDQASASAESPTGEIAEETSVADEQITASHEEEDNDQASASTDK